MLYLYDNEIVKDLQKSFNPDNVPDPVVKVISPEAAIGVTAQLLKDELKFPVVVLERDDNTPIDAERWNFARLHRGVACVFDKEKNNYYYEKILPIDLKYTLTILSTNVADRDELVKELLFKYTQMYFLTIKLPYESDRKIRFGISINPDNEITQNSGVAEYLSSGQLYQTSIPLKCDGAVMAYYTPVQLKRLEYESPEIAQPEHRK